MNFDKWNNRFENALRYIKAMALRPGYYDATTKESVNVRKESYAWHHEDRHRWQDEVGLKLLHDVTYPTLMAAGVTAYALGYDWFILPFLLQFVQYLTLEIDATQYGLRKKWRKNTPA